MSTPRFSPFALGLVSLAGVQPAASLRQDPPAATLRIDSRLVTLEVLVLDRRTGARVEGLGREDFEVLDDGRPVALTHFGDNSGASRPPALALLVSVRDHNLPAVRLLSAALGLALGRLRPEDEIAVVDYWRGHDIRQALTNDRGAVLKAPADLAAGHMRPAGPHAGRDLVAALLAAMRHARERRPQARVALVVIDDDVNVLSRAEAGEIGGRLLAGEVLVNGLISVGGVWAVIKPLPIMPPSRMEHIAYFSDLTGGRR